MGLAAAEDGGHLGDGDAVLLARQPAEHAAQGGAQAAREEGAPEEGVRVAVFGDRVPFDHLGQVHGEDLEVHAPLADVAVGHGDVPPGDLTPWPPLLCGRRGGMLAGLAQDQLDLVDDVGRLGGIGLVPLVDGAVADVDERVERGHVEVDRRPAQHLRQVLVRPAGAVDADQLAQRELVERLPAADLLLGLDQLSLPRGRGGAQELVVELDQQVLQGACGGLDGLGGVALFEEGLGFERVLRVVHVDSIQVWIQCVACGHCPSLWHTGQALITFALRHPDPDYRRLPCLRGRPAGRPDVSL